MPGEKAPTPALSAPLPGSLIDLLTRELAFKQAREKLVHALEETRAHQKVAQATRPPFLLLQRAAVRKEIESTLEDANESIELLERGIAKLDKAEEQLQGLIAHRIEIYLRNSSDAYVLSLISYFHREDWLRLETRMGRYSSELQAALAALGKACDALPRYAAVTLESCCGELMLTAFLAAQQFEREIIFINRLSDTQGRQLKAVEATLTRQIALDWTSALHEIARERVGQASVSLKYFITKHEELSRNALHAIKTESHPAHFSASQEPVSYHARQWEMMRAAVQVLLVSADLQAITEETEYLLASGHISNLAFAEDDGVSGNVTSASLPVPTTTLHLRPRPSVSLRTPMASGTQVAAGQGTAPVLRLPNRKPSEPPRPLAPVAKPAPPSQAKLNAMHDELAQQRELLLAEKAKLQARAQFHAENQANLRASLKLQQEREAELEQRSKELNAIKEQLRRQAPS